MIAVFLPAYPFRGVPAPYLWIFYRLLSSIDEPMLFMVGKDYLEEPDTWKSKKRWEVEPDSKKRLNYRLPSKDDLAKHHFRFVDDAVFSQLMADAGNNPLTAFQQFLCNEVPALEKSISTCLSDFDSNDLEAILTWCNCPSLNSVAESLHLPVIHLELGPLRAPLYKSTAYLDFQGVNGNTEAKRRFLDVHQGCKVNLSIPELREFFCGTAYPTEGARQFETGLVLQVEDDSNLVAFGNSFNNTALLSYARIQNSNGGVLVRTHPGSLFMLKSGEFTIDESASSVEFIDKCNKIVTINSSVGLESILLQVPIEVLGDCSYSFINDTDEQSARTDRLAFYLFNYLVPFERIFDINYLRFRLSSPTELQILESHFEFYHVLDDKVNYTQDNTIGEAINSRVRSEKINRLSKVLSEKESQLLEQEQLIKQLTEELELYKKELAMSWHNRIKRKIKQIWSNYHA